MHRSKTRYVTRTDAIFARGSLAYFAFVLLLGGGGAPDFALHTLIGAVSFAWAAFVIWVGTGARTFSRSSRPLRWVLAALTIWFAIQFLPVPFGLWSALPGRGLAADVLKSVGLAPSSMPLSLHPEGSWLAFVSVIPGIAAVLTTCLLSPEERQRVFALAIIVGIISAILGAVQFANPQTPALYLHKKTYFDLPSGLFANRNFQGLYLLVTILLATAYLRRSESRERLRRLHEGAPPMVFASLFAIPLCSLMAVATLSRFAAAMLLPILALAALSSVRLSRKWRPLFVVVPVACALAIMLLAQTDLGASVAARFREGGARSIYWPSLSYVAQQYLPLGSGFGTFDNVFRPEEPLGLLAPNYLNHAHNDYFELLIEGGLLSILAALATIAWLVALNIGAWRDKTAGTGRWTPRLSAAALLLIVAHSSIDYPLRTATVLALFAFLFTTLVVREPPKRHDLRTRSSDRPRSVRWVAGTVLGFAAVFAVAVTVLQGLSAMAGEANFGAFAARISPFGAEANSRRARELLIAGKPEESQVAALRAVGRSPLDAEAVRLVASSRDQLRRGWGNDAWLAAGRLGWRDGATQLWFVMHAVASGNARTAMRRAEALARTDQARDEVATLMRLLAQDPAKRADLVKALAENPPWRPLFLSQQYAIAPFQLDTMVEVVSALATSKAPPTPEEARPILYALLSENRLPQAYRLHRILFDGASKNILSNGSFERIDIGSTVESNATPFDWLVFDADRSSAAITRATQSSGRVLNAFAGGKHEGRIAAQVVSLSPGTYELRFRVRADQRQAMRFLNWSVGCSTGGASTFTTPAIDLPEGEWTQLRYRFATAATCPGQIVELRAAPNTSGGVTADFDDVALAAVG